MQSLKTSIERLAALGEVEHNPEARPAFLEFREALTQGKIRAAEKIDGRWIVVDPVYRTVLRGSDGGLLTREQLSDPAVFSAATRGIRDYNSQDNYQLTAHVRMGRLGLIGLPLRNGLNRVLPGWEDSTALSLLMERESLATMVFALVSVFLLGFLRVGLRWYGERRLGIQPLRIRQQVRRAFHAFVDASG